MYLDTITISAIIVIIAAFLGIAMLVDWSRDRVHRHSAMWAAGNGSLAFGWLLLSLRGVIPDFLSIVFSNTLIALCLAFLLIGTQWFLYLRANYYFSGGIVVAVFIGQTFWLVIGAPVEVRIVYVPTLISVLCAYCAWILITHDDGRTTYPQKTTAAVFGAVGIVSMFVVVSFIGSPTFISDLFEPSLAVTVLFLTFLMGVIGWSVGFLMMVGQRRYEDLRIQREILTNMAEGVNMIRTSDATIVYANPKFESMFGYDLGELKGIHASVLNAGSEMTAKETAGNIALGLERNKIFSCEVHNIKKDRTTFWCRAHISTFDHAQFGNVWVSVHEDITVRKRAEANLRESEERLQSILDNTEAVVYLKDINGRFLLINHQYEKVFQVKKRDIVGMTDYDYFPKEQADAFTANDLEVVSLNSSKQYEEAVQQSNGNHTYISLKFPLVRADGTPYGVCGISTDITERKQAEEALQEAHDGLEMRVKERTAELAKANAALRIEIAERKQAEEKIKSSLKEKELLLREVHHRVKNNLQGVSGLLGLQAYRMEDTVDPATLAIFRESATRIKSMALVHERLYCSKDLAHVDFQDYIRQLAKDLFHNYDVHSDTIALDIRVEDVEVDISQAVPCGMITNELLSNALKHAFPKGGRGQIEITLQPFQGRMLELKVCDNGLGLPEELDVEKTETLGLTIVKALVEQLDGEMVLDRSRGTCFRIRFTGG